MPAILVDLAMQMPPKVNMKVTRQKNTLYETRLELGDVPVLDLSVRRVVRPTDIEPFHCNRDTNK